MMKLKLQEWTAWPEGERAREMQSAMIWKDVCSLMARRELGRSNQGPGPCRNDVTLVES